MSLAAGSRLGPYEIVAPIGAGGMGEVFRARDTELDRDVAIKALPEELATDPERVARFEREAKLLASVNHPNVATLYGVERSEGKRFLAMELVEGDTLAERIANGAISIDEACRLVSQIAEGLEAAHEKGVIHRDLKPDNVKVTPEGKVKILDFGLAKASGEGAGRSGSSESPTIEHGMGSGTGSGVILGTAPYMSPEQANGKRVDERTDVWALGCVLYEALSGRKAFSGETVSETLAAILKDEPSWERLPAETPDAIRALLRRCLRKDASRRVHAVADVRIELEDDLAGAPESSAAAADGDGARTASWLYASSIVAVVATGVAVWALVRSTPATPSSIVRTSISLAAEQELFLTARPTVAIARDGRAVAYVTTDGDGTQLYLRTLSDLEARPVEGGENASMPFFSPDGQWLGFATQGALMKASVNGGAPVELAKVNNARGASWALDGTIVFVPSGGGGIWRVSEDGGEPELLIAPNRELREKTYRFPQVLPGGKAVVFTLGTGDIEFWDDAAIALLSLETGEYRILLRGGSNPVYSPTGHLVYARNGSLFAVAFDLERLELTGAPVPVLEGVITSPTKGPAAFSLSRTGSLVYARGAPWGTDFQVVLVDRNGEAEPLVASRRAFTEAVPSPDGRLLALSVDNANGELWLFDIERGTLSRLISGFDNLGPVWTPDGKKLTFWSSRGGSMDIFWQAADGSADAVVLVASEDLESPDSWGPDGKTLAFDRFRPETQWDVWVARVDSDEPPRPLAQTPANEGNARFSPDGRWIAYESDETGQYEVYVRSFPDSGAKRQVSTEGGRSPIWAPDGRELFYRDGNKQMRVGVGIGETLALGQPELLFERPFVFTAYNETLYHLMPDGERFVMIDGSYAPPPPTKLILVQNWTQELSQLVPTDE